MTADAIALARDLGGPRGRNVLANVVAATVPVPVAFALIASRRNAEALLDDERRRTRIGAETITACDSSAGRALHDLAVSEHADLVVVSAAGRRHLAALSRSSVALDEESSRRHMGINPDGLEAVGA